MNRARWSVHALASLGIMAAALPAPGRGAEPADLRIAYLERTGDPAYQAAPAYTGVFRKARGSPFPAAELAIRDATVAARAAGLRLTVERRTLADGEDAATAMRDWAEAGHVAAAVLDLPLAEVERVAMALGRDGPVLINSRHREDDLRQTACHSRLLHILPSWSMYMDALAQGLLAANWRSVLVLQGSAPDDQRIASAFLASARKFGLRIAATRDFVHGNDPRKRDQINIRLLTSVPEYDVVFVADASGDFARTVPYNTQKPRPVIGSAGLMAHAWHPFWERHGAPQLNRRFARQADRQMTDEDWATWAGVRMVVAGLIDSRGRGGASELMRAMTDPAFRLDLYKGIPGSIRPWSLQLRQAMLLATHDAVIGLAPVEGVAHHRNDLDTLGPDEPEFRCRS